MPLPTGIMELLETASTQLEDVTAKRVAKDQRDTEDTAAEMAAATAADELRRAKTELTATVAKLHDAIEQGFLSTNAAGLFPTPAPA